MTDYIVNHWGWTGVIRRADPDFQVVAFLHCGQAEARKIAEDLGARFEDSYFEDKGSDCPTQCTHVDQ